jgi:hypothetical protein
MMNRRGMLALLAGALALVFCSSVTAAERRYWRHSTGHFENTTGNEWVEKINEKTWHFKEVKRTDAYVELYDKTRDLYVRLHNNKCWVKAAGKDYEDYYDGKWDK